MKLVGLPVFTDMGDRVGAVASLEYDKNGQVKIYHIRKAGFSRLLRKEVLIHPSAVISIDEKKMVVKGSELELKEPVIRPAGVLVSN
jgi:sporulation protein YlmC with PRC-barrel domain